MRASLASYARYWREAFRLPSMDKGQSSLNASMSITEGQEYLQAALDAAGRRPALPHSGNWDLSAVWLVHKHGSFSPPSRSG